ncbi:MAG: DUF3501 family protein [Thermoplasmatota archaeon]
MTVDAARRQHYRLIQEHKAPRRMALADDVSLLWESETTIDHQVAEMLWMEEDPESRAAIKAGYAELTPRPDRPTCTVSVEVTDPAHIKTRLGFYAGLEQAFSLECGGTRVPAQVIGDHGTDEATTAVIYLAFPLPPAADLAGATLIVDHPRLQGRFPLPAAVASSPL